MEDVIFVPMTCRGFDKNNIVANLLLKNSVPILSLIS
jgi:hypothetical protein